VKQLTTKLHLGTKGLQSNYCRKNIRPGNLKKRKPQKNKTSRTTTTVRTLGSLAANRAISQQPGCAGPHHAGEPGTTRYSGATLMLLSPRSSLDPGRNLCAWSYSVTPAFLDLGSYVQVRTTLVIKNIYFE